MNTDCAPALSPAHAADDAVPTTKLDQVFSMDEYTRAFEAEHAAAKAAKSASGGLKRTPGGINANIPTPGTGPIVISARSSKYTVALHDKYQGLGIPQPTFTFEGSSDRGWNGKVSFPGLDVEELQGIEEETIYSNKKQSKEALSERVLEILLRLEREGKVKKADANTRARASKSTVALHDKHQKLGIPQPFFEYSGSAQEGWIAEVTFPGLWVHEVPGMRNATPFPSKSEAKEALSERALKALETAEKEGKLERLGAIKRSAQQDSVEKREPGPNYLGQLLGLYLTYHIMLVLIQQQNSNMLFKVHSPHTQTTASAPVASPAKSPSKTASMPMFLARSTPTTPQRKPHVKKPPATPLSTTSPRASGPTPPPTSAASGRRPNCYLVNPKSFPPLPQQSLLLRPILTSPVSHPTPPSPTPAPHRTHPKSPALPSFSPCPRQNGATRPVR
jgi:hypothetical protein